MNLKSFTTNLNRFLKILSTIFSFFSKSFIHKTTPQQRAILLRQHIEQLGSVFVKFGQFLSIHPTFLPPLYCEELFYLLENVPPFPYEEVEQIFQQEFQTTPNKLFQSFNHKPMAAASFGQVHEATLKTGERVAVKIQRPHIEQTLQQDIGLMKLIARIIDIFPIGANKITTALEEFERWSKEELDYITEAKVTQEYHRQFGTKRKSNSIISPRIYSQYSSSKILTAEFIEGITLSKILLAIREQDEATLKKLKQMGFSRKAVALQLSNDIFKQVYLKGFFHADPHPANIIYTAKRQLAYIDFGVCGRLNKVQRILLLRYVRSLWYNDVENSFQALLQLCDTSKVKDMQKFKDDFTKLTNDVYTYRRNKTKHQTSFFIKNQLQENLKILQRHNAILSTETLLYYRTAIITRNVTFFLYPQIQMEEMVQQLKTISILSLIAELPQLLEKNRSKFFKTVINGIEQEIIETEVKAGN